ncbi:hypothetical protein HDU67_008771 [Dinochytrium kinnereticum]|nr:hypothetical protein HDU67_008771 [Dinochytrium kinnereticum]
MQIPSTLLMATTAAGLYALLRMSFMAMAVAGDYVSLNATIGFVVGAWLCLSVLQNAVFLPLAAVANLLIHESNRHLASVAVAWTMRLSWMLSDAVTCLLVYLLIRIFQSPDGFFRKTQPHRFASQRSLSTIILASGLGSFVKGTLKAAIPGPGENHAAAPSFGLRMVQWAIPDFLGCIVMIPFVLCMFHCIKNWKSDPSTRLFMPTAVRVALGMLCIIGIVIMELGFPHIPSNDTIFSPVAVPFVSHLFAFPLALTCGTLIGPFGFTFGALALAMTATIVMAQASNRLDGSELNQAIFRFQLLIGIGLLTILAFMAVDRSRLEALAESIHASNQKSAFMAFLCHEIRNPLHAVLNLSTFLKESEGLTKDQQQLCEAIIIASTYTSDIIEDVMDTSKFESGTVNLKARPCDVVRLYSDTAIQTQAFLETRQIQFRSNASDVTRSDLQFWTDEMRLKQLLNNLLANVIKVTPQQGQVSAEISCDSVRGHIMKTVVSVLQQIIPPSSSTPVRPNTHVLCFRVSSSTEHRTITSSPPDLSTIAFRPFEMSNLETFEEYNGSGLGLAICKQIVDLMGGTIEVMQEAHQYGFIVYLPMASVNEHEPLVDDVDTGDEEGLRVSRELSGIPLAPLRWPDTMGDRSSIYSNDHAKGLGRDVSSTGVASLKEYAIPDVSEKRHSRICITEDWKVSLTEEAITLHQEPRSVAGSFDDHADVPSSPDSNIFSYAPKSRRTHSLVNHPPLPVPSHTSLNLSLTSIAIDSTDSVNPSLENDHVPSPSRHPTPIVPTTILIVDDSSINRRIIHRLLTIAFPSRFPVVIECTNGLEALVRVRETDAASIACIFMDLQMPVMGGREATERIREEPGMQDTPILAVTASVVDVEGLKGLGFSGCLNKPVGKMEIVRWLKEMGVV